MKRVIKSLFEQLGYDIKKNQVRSTNKYNWMHEMSINTIIDVGANIGDWAAEIHHFIPNAQIFAFEPLTVCYNEISKNCPSATAINMAVGNQNGEIEIQQSSHITSSSILKMAKAHKDAFPESSKHKIQKVKITTLDDFFEGKKLDTNIFLKVDTQGYEGEVIKGGQKTLMKSKIVLLETSFVELYEGQPLFASIYNDMIDLGFVYAGNQGSIYDRNSGIILQENSIFVNSGI